MTAPTQPDGPRAPLPHRDDFGDPTATLPPAAGGGGRFLVDAEGIAGLDNGAVRFAPPLRQGWGRAALACGPWPRRPGLTLAAYLLNGHNTSQVEPLPDAFKARLDRWLRASEQEGRGARLRAWLHSGRVRRTFRSFRWWWRLRREQRAVARLDENLAVGWHAQPAPADPVGGGAGFVMHATGAENGELWVSAGGVSQPVAAAVPDVPLALAVILRERGALYCAGATPGAPGLPAYPWVRPLAIDTRSDEAFVHGVVSPAAWGQIGFRIDTRVHAVQAAVPTAFTAWCGPALAADRFTDGDEPCARPAERGGDWEAVGGAFRCGVDGLTGAATGALMLRPVAPDGLGLLHVLVRNAGAGAGLVARAADAGNCVCVTLSAGGCAVHEMSGGIATLLAETADLPADGGPERALQLSLDGAALAVAVDGRRILQATTTRASADGEAVGVHVIAGEGTQPTATLRDFEAHATRLLLPPDLCVAPAPVPCGEEPIAEDSFEGAPGPLGGRVIAGGGATWTRRIGRGRIELTGDGAARVVASAQSPNPGRTAFTLPWRSPELADLAVTMTIPGDGPGLWHKPRGGFLFRQDDDNFLIVSLWRGDEYPGASLSSFFHFRGFEDTYDAVWSNIGRRAWYGEQVRLRVAFDGRQFLAELDGQPVLYRRLTDFYADAPPLAIREVGLVVNWEWGNDTGTVFRDFRALGAVDAR